MSKLEIHAGDFPKGNGSISFSQICFPRKPGDGWTGEIVGFTKLKEVELASEDSVKKIGGTIGWGAVGGLALGPVGLLAGLLLGGKGKTVTFVAKFEDGRKFLATTDSKTYTKLKAAVF